MFLSDTEIVSALDSGDLIVEPRPSNEAIGPSSIDLHLDGVDSARIWDTETLAQDNQERGDDPLQLRIARMKYGTISRKYLCEVPHERDKDDSTLVFRRDDSVVLRPGGFLLWQTSEVIGTPEEEPRYICFIDGKSTRARTGLVIHLTAPTIHAGWSGNVTLEMTNMGPIDLVLHEGDSVAQIVIGELSSCPSVSMRDAGSATAGQTDVSGSDQTPNEH